MRSTIDLAWCAGFLEGEGSFQKHGRSIGIQCSQVQREPLEKLQGVLGGKIYNCRPRTPKQSPYFMWALYGTKAAAAMMTLLAFMSPKRWVQITTSLDHWKQTDRPGERTHCRQGHPYSGDNLYIQPSNGGRQCKACRSYYRERMNQRREAALQGA